MQSTTLKIFLCLSFLVVLLETGDAFATQGLSAHKPSLHQLEARRNPFRKIRNLFRQPKVTANFPVDGKKVKITAEKSEELSQKYKTIDSVEEKAYQVVMDLELVDTKWRRFDKCK